MKTKPVLLFPAKSPGLPWAGKRHSGGEQVLSGQLCHPPPTVQLRQNLLSSLFPDLENEGVEEVISR